MAKRGDSVPPVSQMQLCKSLLELIWNNPTQNCSSIGSRGKPQTTTSRPFFYGDHYSHDMEHLEKP
jgi:hypothetical protein